MAKPEFKTRCAKLQSIVHWITGVGAEITMVWSRRNQFSHGRDIKKYISHLVLKMWIACDRKEPHVFSLRLLWNTIFSWDRLFGDCCWWDNSWGLIIGCFFFHSLIQFHVLTLALLIVSWACIVGAKRTM